MSILESVQKYQARQLAFLNEMAKHNQGLKEVLEEISKWKCD